MALLDEHVPFPGITAAWPVIGTLFLLAAVHGEECSLVVTLLENRWSVAIGVLSYSLYLWRWPVYCYLTLLMPEGALFKGFLATLVSLLLAHFSYKIVEEPIRRRRILRSPVALATALSGGGATLIALCGVAIYSEGLPQRMRAPDSEVSRDVAWHGEEFETGVESRDWKPLGAQDDRLTDRHPSFVLWGDSHGMVLARAFDRAATHLNIEGIAICQSGMPPGFGFVRPTRGSTASQVQRQEWILEDLTRLRPRRLYLACRWAGYVAGPTSQDRSRVPPLLPRPEEGLDEDARSASSSQLLGAGICEVSHFCEAMGIDLIIIRQVPEVSVSSPASRVLREAQGLPAWTVLPERVSAASWTDRSERVASWLHALPLGEYRELDLFSEGDAEGGILLRSDSGRALYRDNDHLSWTGAESLVPAITKELSGLAVLDE